MKILFVANRVPYPPFRGDKLKIYNLAKRLSAKHQLYLITFAESKDDFKYKKELSEVFSEILIISLPKWQSYLQCILAVFSKTPFQVAYFKSRKMSHCIVDFIARFEVDVIHTQHLRMAQFTENLSLPKILDLPDAFSLYWQRRIQNQKNQVLRFFEKWEFKRLFDYEGQINIKFNTSLVCSAEDLKYLQEKHHIQNLKLLRNGVDLNTFKSDAQSYEIEAVLLFTGNMDYAPNIDAVLYFVNDILPLIKKSVPEAKFIIAGQRPVREIRELQSETIEVTGFVQNLMEVYENASVVVSPLRFGAGTQNKVLEALAMGIPVVSGPIGFSGLELQTGEGVFMETEPQLFAQKVIELLHSKELRKKTGERGKLAATQKFSWDIISLQLERYFQECLE